MKCSIILIPLLIASAIATAQPVQKSLVKSFNLQGMDRVVLNIGENVQVQQWAGDVMRIQMDIALANGTESTLKSLVEAGRYNLKSENKGDAWYITAPALQRQVKLNGTEIKDIVKYMVFVPTNVAVVIQKTEPTPSTPSDSNAIKVSSL